MRRRLLVVPVVALVVCLGGVALTWLTRSGDDRAATVGAGAGSVSATELTLPSPVAPLASSPSSTVPVPAPAVAPLTSTASGPAGNTARGMPVGRGGPVASPALAADAVGRRIGLYANAGDAEPGEWLDNPTWEGLDVVFLVQEGRGDWLHVQFAMRPNQATAWVRAADVRTRQVDYQIVVDVSQLRLVLYRDYRPVFEAPVAVGKGSTPTPIGNFFIDGIVALRDITGPYGSHQLSVAGYSEVYTSFAGGIGQIALHGTNQPNLLGSPVSNGCVRMRNADIAHLASLVPTGTPVQIVA